MHISTMSITQTLTDRAKITVAPTIMSHVGFQLVCFEMTLTYSEVNLAIETVFWLKIF